MRRTTVSEMAFIVVLRLEIEAEQQILWKFMLTAIAVTFKFLNRNRIVHLIDETKEKPFLQIVHCR